MGGHVGKSFKSLCCKDCPAKSKSIFCELESPALDQISDKKNTNTYKKGSTIFHDGNPSFGLYCVNSGRIKVSKIGNDGKEVIVRIANDGDILGHRSLFSNENYTATAKIIEDSTICFFDKNYIFEVIQHEPTVAMHLIKRLSLAMGEAESKSASIIQKNVRGRLAEMLLGLKKTYGITEGNKTRLNITLTREELASMVGIANETAIRLISEFKEDGLIIQNGKSIYIADEDKLIEYANMG